MRHERENLSCWSLILKWMRRHYVPFVPHLTDSEGGNIFSQSIQHWHISSNTSSWSRDPKAPQGSLQEVKVHQIPWDSSSHIPGLLQWYALAPTQAQQLVPGMETCFLETLGKVSHTWTAMPRRRALCFHHASSCWAEKRTWRSRFTLLCVCVHERVESSPSSFRFFKLLQIWLGSPDLCGLQF